MCPDTTMEALGETAKAATKMGEIVQCVFGPHWTRKQADADAYADTRKLQLIRDNPDMEIVYIDGKLNARAHDQSTLVSRAEQRLLTETLRQEDNIEKVFEVAANELSSAETVSDEPVDNDWITRFFNIAKDVSNEDMQRVWGKILAGEIQKPGKFSYRTMETLRNLSQREATMFQKIMPFVMRAGGECFFSSNEDLLNEYNIIFADLLLLQECGLVNISLSNNPSVSQTKNSFLYSDTVIVHFWGYTDEEVTLRFGVHTLTTAGKELYSILAHNGDKSYAIKWAEIIFKENKESAKIYLHDVHDIADKIIHHSTEPFQCFINETKQLP